VGLRGWLVVETILWTIPWPLARIFCFVFARFLKGDVLKEKKIPEWGEIWSLYNV